MIYFFSLDKKLSNILFIILNQYQKLLIHFN